MEIKKIKLLSGGYKGAEVTYLKPEMKNKKEFINEIVEKRKHPIHGDMEKPFRDLRYHLLEICGYLSGPLDKSEIDYMIAECEIVSISFKSGMFVLSGTKKTIVGNKEVSITTPKIEDEDGYSHFDTVMKIIETIIEETHQYLSGTKKVSDEEVAVRFITSGKDKSEEAERYNNMTLEERREYHTRILQQIYGSVVYHNEDLDLETIQDAEVLESNIKDEFELKLDVEETIIPLPAK